MSCVYLAQTLAALLRELKKMAVWRESAKDQRQNFSCGQKQVFWQVVEAAVFNLCLFMI